VEPPGLSEGLQGVWAMVAELPQQLLGGLRWSWALLLRSGRWVLHCMLQLPPPLQCQLQEKGLVMALHLLQRPHCRAVLIAGLLRLLLLLVQLVVLALLLLLLARALQALVCSAHLLQ